MAGQKDSKLKLLYLQQIFWYKTDEDHPMNAARLVEELKLYDINAERKSIYADIENLQSYGLDIVYSKSPKNGYFLASRHFELAEIKMLADAVTAAHFISEKKSGNLIKKFYTQISEAQAAELSSQINIINSLKCKNEELYYSVDMLNTAIVHGCKAEFTYTKRVLTGRMTYKAESKVLTVSPYALIWINDRYYLVANNAKYDNLMHVRLDRISKVKLLPEDARPLSEVSEYREAFDAADYTAKVFNMFTGATQKITLRCDNDLLESMLDRFGEDIPLKNDGTAHFQLKTKAAVSDGLVCWLLQFGEKIQVLEPQSLADCVKEKAEKIRKIYHVKGRKSPPKLREITAKGNDRGAPDFVDNARRVMIE